MVTAGAVEKRALAVAAVAAAEAPADKQATMEVGAAAGEVAGAPWLELARHYGGDNAVEASSTSLTMKSKTKKRHDKAQRQRLRKRGLL
jgi:hypothetical protein